MDKQPPLLNQVDQTRALSSHDVAKLLQVNATSINKWADDGEIESYRTPGGHRRFTTAAVVKFVEKYRMPMPKAAS